MPTILCAGCKNTFDKPAEYDDDVVAFLCDGCVQKYNEQSYCRSGCQAMCQGTKREI